MISCTRRIQFCAGHRVMGHEGKCRNIHGHNYVVYITAQASNLDKLGRVIDFSVLKEKVGGWIEENWDHGFIICSADVDVRDSFDAFDQNAGFATKRFLLPCNPTAENMAQYLLEVVCLEVLWATEVRVTKIRVWETENCYADAEVQT